MMSLETICALADDAAAIARNRGKYPRAMPLNYSELSPENREQCLRHIPNVGSWRPRGWYITRLVLVDKTGWGAEHELALTYRAFRDDWVRSGECLAIIEESQCQVVIATFVKGRKPADFTPEYGPGTYHNDPNS